MNSIPPLSYASSPPPPVGKYQLKIWMGLFITLSPCFRPHPESDFQPISDHTTLQ